MINTVPMAERHPDLRHPVFRALASLCIQHAAMPASLDQSWDDCDGGDDEDSFMRFREQARLRVLSRGERRCCGGGDSASAVCVCWWTDALHVRPRVRQVLSDILSNVYDVLRSEFLEMARPNPAPRHPPFTSFLHTPTTSAVSTREALVTH